MLLLRLLIPIFEFLGIKTVSFALFYLLHAHIPRLGNSYFWRKRSNDRIGHSELTTRGALGPKFATHPIICTRVPLWSIASKLVRIIRITGLIPMALASSELPPLGWQTRHTTFTPWGRHLLRWTKTCVATDLPVPPGPLVGGVWRSLCPYSWVQTGHYHVIVLSSPPGAAGPSPHLLVLSYRETNSSSHLKRKNDLVRNLRCGWKGLVCWILTENCVCVTYLDFSLFDSDLTPIDLCTTVKQRHVN